MWILPSSKGNYLFEKIPEVQTADEVKHPANRRAEISPLN